MMLVLSNHDTPHYPLDDLGQVDVVTSLRATKWWLTREILTSVRDRRLFGKRRVYGSASVSFIKKKLNLFETTMNENFTYRFRLSKCVN